MFARSCFGLSITTSSQVITFTKFSAKRTMFRGVIGTGIPGWDLFAWRGTIPSLLLFPENSVDFSVVFMLGFRQTGFYWSSRHVFANSRETS
jgi:hypothetical protein